MRLHHVWLAFWLVTLAFAVVFVADTFPVLRGDAPWIPAEGRFVWLTGVPDWTAVIVSALAVALYTLGAWRLIHACNSRPLILWAYTGAALLPLALMTFDEGPLFLLFTRSASTITGGYQYAASMITDFGAAISDWRGFVDAYLAEARLDPPSGVALSPPGLVALYEGVGALFTAAPPIARQFSDILRPLQCQNLTLMAWRDADLASAWLQMFMPLWAGLGVAPLYRLGRLLSGERQARIAVALWPLVPGMTIFQPRFNVFFPLITLVALLTLWRGLLLNQPRSIALSGFVIAAGLLLNLSLIPLGLLAGLVILGTYKVEKRATAGRNGAGQKALQRAARNMAVFGAGVASVWLIYGALIGRSPLDVLGDGFGRHTNLYRPYLPWLIHHPYDMFLFVGWPVALLAVWRMIRLARLRAHGAPANRVDILAGASAVTLAILILSGTARGETGRVWLFFAPVWLLLAADLLAGAHRQFTGDGRETLHILAMQAVLLVSIAAVLRPNFTALTVPITVGAAETAPTYPVDAQFAREDDSVTLVGLDVEAQADTVTLNLHWKANTRVGNAYVLALISIAPDGTALPGYEWNPRDWEYPPSCWTPGRTFVDTVTVPLGTAAQPGNWLFSLSILDAFTLEPMLVTLPDGTSSAQVGIGPVRVPEP